MFRPYLVSILAVFNCFYAYSFQTAAAIHNLNSNVRLEVQKWLDTVDHSHCRRLHNQEVCRLKELHMADKSVKCRSADRALLVKENINLFCRKISSDVYLGYIMKFFAHFNTLEWA